MTTKGMQSAGGPAVSAAIQNLGSEDKAELAEDLLALIGEVVSPSSAQELIDAAPEDDDREVLIGTLRDVNLPHVIAIASGDITIDGAEIPSTRCLVEIDAAATVLFPVNLRQHILYEITFVQTGAYAVTLPAHNATDSGVTLKRMNTFPDFPLSDGGRFILMLRLVEVGEAEFEIHATCGGACAD